MTPEQIVNEVTKSPQSPSTAGMTTKVVKGSFWILAGQVFPMFATLVTTPLVIRLLGSESYGVLILVGLIPNYFSFADFGMGLASTKFASEEYARGDLEGEARAVRSAAFIALICSCLVALPIVVFAGPIINQFNVPENLRWEAVWGLRMACGTFVVMILSNVVNTPQLSRLRMDLNAGISAASKIGVSVGTVVVLYLGGSIIGAAAWGLIVGFTTLISHVFVSGRLLDGFVGIRINGRLVKPLLRFGLGLTISGLASLVLVNFEKLLLTRLSSVRELAFYSIAFTFANMATFFSLAMAQSLVPAFAQLLDPKRKSEFLLLFKRSIRLSTIVIVPMIIVMLLLGRPFFTFWAGPDFGRESTVPFYVLLIGLFFNLLAYIPFASLVAAGRTASIAKIHAAEVVPYFLLALLLISKFGITGAALAWSIRVTIDAFVFLWFTWRILGAQFEAKLVVLVVASACVAFAVPTLIALLYNNFSPWIIPATVVSIVVYAAVIWSRFIESPEKTWLISKVRSLFKITRRLSSTALS